MTQYCTFRLDGQLFGVPVAHVQEVMRPQPVTPVPLAAKAVTGLMNLRGRIVTTLELRARLGLPARDAAHPGVCVVVGAHGATPVSVVVDAIGDVVEPEPAAHSAPPETVPATVRMLVASVCTLPDELLLVLDTDAVTSLR